MASWSGSRARVTSIGLIVSLVAANALLRGGVDLVAVTISTVVTLAALATAPRPGRDRIGLPLLVPGLGLVVALVAVQLVPVPPAILQVVSPAASRTLDQSLGPMGLFPAWRPVSLDPGATALELAKAVLFTLVAAAASVLSESERRRDQLLRGVALSGAVVVGCYYGAALLGWSPLVAPTVTFVNTNHLAGFLQLAAWPALGFALRARGAERAGWLLAFVFAGSGVFLSLSRAGIAAFFVAAGVFAFLRSRVEAAEAAAAQEPADDAHATPRARPIWRRLLRDLRASGRTLTIVAITGSLSISAWLASDRIVSELRSLGEESTTAVKLGLWPVAATLVREFPLFGIGRGAFESVFPAYKLEPLQRTFTHVENEWLQLPAELGLVPGLALIGLFGWAFVAAARSRELSRPTTGALAGAGALALHNLFDFSLELPGVAIPFAVVMGIAARSMPRVEVRTRTALRVAAVAFALACAGLLWHRKLAQRVDAAAVAAATTADDAIARARAALDARPADWIPHAAVGLKLAAEQRCADALPWLTRAMLRNPTAPEAHRAAAYCLARNGQHVPAKQEYRLAFMYGDQGALADAVRFYPEPDELLQVAPDTPAGLLAAGRILAHRPADAARVWARAWELFSDRDALAALARARQELGEHDEALRLARLLQGEAPRSSAGYVIAASALGSLGRREEAVQELETGAARLPGDESILSRLGSWHLGERRFSRAKALFEAITARDAPAQGRKRVLIARALEGQGRYQEALREAQSARELLPRDAGVLVMFANLAARSGRHDEAIDALEVAARLPDAKPGAYDARLAALREARETHRLQRSLQGLGGR